MNLRDKLATTVPGELAIWISKFLYNYSHKIEQMNACDSPINRLHEIRAILERIAIEELRRQSKEFVEENKWIFELEAREADEKLVPKNVAEGKVDK